MAEGVLRQRGCGRHLMPHLIPGGAVNWPDSAENQTRARLLSEGSPGGGGAHAVEGERAEEALGVDLGKSVVGGSGEDFLNQRRQPSQSTLRFAHAAWRGDRCRCRSARRNRCMPLWQDSARDVRKRKARGLTDSHLEHPLALR